MKNKKADFDKFKQRAAVRGQAAGKKRSTDRQRAKAELLRALESTGVGHQYAKLRDTHDLGYGGRKSRGKESVGEGRFSETAYGYGFVSLSEGGRDIFIPAEHTGGALGGDTVEISYHSFLSHMGEEKTEGRVTSILEEGRRDIIGTVYRESYRHGRRLISSLYLLPDDSSVKRKFFVTDSAGLEISEGDKVMARIIRDRGLFKCRILSSFGSSLSKEANYAAILAEHSIETEFTEKELSSAELEAGAPLSLAGRVLRHEVILTMDSESAKDLDDAVSAERTDDGYRLGVHIADVSHYVKEKTPLDRLVMRRGTSVYFTDKVIPMLPESLSNGACSLSPGEDKYALSCIIDLDRQGNIKATRLEESVIRSRVKGIYSEINRLLQDEGDPYLEEKYRDTKDTILLLHELYLILEEKSRERGALELDSAEAEILLDAEGAPSAIIPRERGESERMIEQFMITANVAVAKLLSDAGLPCIYRVHQPPREEKLEAFVELAHTLGFGTDVISRAHCGKAELSRLLSLSRERGVGETVSYALLRSMNRAEYSEIRADHYGLGLEYYCHFTSPIRRLPDLITHRIIKNAYLGTESGSKYLGMARRGARAATDSEERATAAERRIEELYKVIYMSDRIGESFEGRISSVTSFGLFVTLPNTCEGLIPISEMGYGYIYEEKTLTVRGAEGVYRIGDTLKVRLEEADIRRGKLRFSIIKGRRTL